MSSTPRISVRRAASVHQRNRIPLPFLTHILPFPCPAAPPRPHIPSSRPPPLRARTRARCVRRDVGIGGTVVCAMGVWGCGGIAGVRGCGVQLPRRGVRGGSGCEKTAGGRGGLATSKTGSGKSGGHRRGWAQTRICGASRRLERARQRTRRTSPLDACG
ncbi:hypothetical protein C8J57DRAFT_1273707 [Mycena rebaudengoi]|nr:hypothetical protein C8J57DRAFT_1273707 [Mycena rebaudengoi]